MTGSSVVRSWSAATGIVLLSGAMALGLAGMGYAAAPPPTPTPVAATPAPVTHPDADSLGSTIRLHEPADTAPEPAAMGLRQLAIVAQPYGMDVSNFQGNVDWPAAKRAGAAFAYIKATESTTYQNSYFAQQYNGSYAAGLVRGAYHFALPDRSSGATQAKYFVARGGGWSADGQTLPPMLDIEYNPYGASTCYGLTPTQLVSWVRDFSNTVRALTTRYPTIYTSTDYWNYCTGSNATFGSTNPLFIARYAATVGPMPAGWAFQSIWQYNDHGPFPGDADVFNGSAAQLVALAGRPVVTPTPPAPPKPPDTTVDPVAAYYLKLGGQPRLGNPIGAARAIAGGEVRDYQGGSIYHSSATGTHLVKGAILARYRSLGGPATIGFPITDELAVGDTVGGRYNKFFPTGNRAIYWSAKTGAHVVIGGILTHWTALGGPGGFLGYPTTDELATAPLGARYNAFTGGAITWTRAIGAYEIHGAIRARWVALNTQLGPLGFPTSDEFSVSGGQRSNFQHGTLTWIDATHVITAAYK